MELNFNLIMTQVLFGLALGAVYILMACGLTIIFGLLEE
jgi:branched-subunit amino acid ABC-type transport system permease component